MFYLALEIQAGIAQLDLLLDQKLEEQSLAVVECNSEQFFVLQTAINMLDSQKKVLESRLGDLR